MVLSDATFERDDNLFKLIFKTFAHNIKSMHPHGATELKSRNIDDVVMCCTILKNLEAGIIAIWRYMNFQVIYYIESVLAHLLISRSPEDTN